MVENRYSMNSRRSEVMVSVIILNYDGREHLDVCLSSLLDLAFPKEQLEIIVVDNGSTDDSVAFIKSRFPDIVLIQNEVNLGFSKAANVGAASAKGEYLGFLNNDMRVDKNWLSVLVETARARKGFAFVGSTVLNWDGTAVDFMGRRDDPFCLAYTSTRKSASASPASSGYSPALFVSAGAAIIQRKVFQALGGFDPDFFLYHEDVDLGWRLWLRGYQCALSTESLVYHKGGATSSKLPTEFIQRLGQKHTLFSIFKNLDAANLREALPLLLFFLLDRGRWVPGAQQSLALAIQEFQSSLDSLIAKRNEVQMTRTRSDAEIFALLGNPCSFLLRQSSNESIRKALVDGCSEIDFDPNNPKSVRNAIAEWLNRAHFLHESNLNAELERVLARGAQRLSMQSEEYEMIIRTRDEAIARLQGEVHGSQQKAERLQAEVHEYREEAERLAASTESLRVAQDQKELGMQMLSSQLAQKETELERITNSIGWRLLSRYGRVKYRYLLPVYRLLGLVPSDKK